MREIVCQGKTIEEATHLGLEQLKFNEETEIYETEVIDEGKSGILFFGKPAAVKIIVRKDKVKIVRNILKKVVQTFEIEVDLDMEFTSRDMFVSLNGDDVGILIGKRGQTLQALEYLLNLIANRDDQEDKIRISLDIANYKENRRNSLDELAGRLADKVKRTKKTIELEPMQSHERKIIHLALQDDDHVYTYSKGEEPNRKIVISSKDKKRVVPTFNKRRPTTVNQG